MISGTLFPTPQLTWGLSWAGQAHQAEGEAKGKEAAELHGVSSCLFWAEARRQELISAAEGEGVLFPRAEGSTRFPLLGIGSTLGKGCGLEELDFLPGGCATGLGWALHGYCASPLRRCFCSIRNAVPSLMYCRLESLWPWTEKWPLGASVSLPVKQVG